MFAITINEKGGEAKRLEFDKPEVTIGRVQGNDIILPKGNVSKRHSRIVLKDGKFIIVDLKSTNGTYVNGRKITSPLVIKGTDKVYIGDFILSVEEQAGDGAPADLSPPPMAPPGGAPRRSTMPPPPPARKMPSAAPPEADGGMDDLDAPGGQGMMGDVGDPMAGADDDLPAPPLADPEPPPEPPPRPRPQPIAAPQRASQPIAPSRPMEAAARPTMMGDAGRPVATQRPPAMAPVAPSRGPSAAPAAAPRPRTASAPAVAQVQPIRRAPLPPVAPPVDEAKRAPVSDAMRQLAARLVAQLALDTMEREELANPNLWPRAEQAVQEMTDQLAADGGLPMGVDRDSLVKDVVAETLGLGPIEELLNEEGVREVAVPRHDRIFVDRGDGQIQLADKWFSSPEAVAKVVERLTGGAMSHDGLVEARLTDGTLVTAAVGPLARGGAFTLRRPRHDATTLAELVGRGSLSQAMADVLVIAVEQRRNVVVSGAPASGRSTLVGALANASRDGERLVTVEESEELPLRQTNWMQLTARPGGIGEAVAAALRLRPERLVVGDVRGSEALAVIEAAAALPGVITAVYGTSSADALARLEALALLARGNLEARALRDAIARTFQVVVHVGRGADGARRVLQISEVTGTRGDGRPELVDVFVATPDGRFAATGHVPAFAEGAPTSLFRA